MEVKYRENKAKWYFLHSNLSLQSLSLFSHQFFESAGVGDPNRTKFWEREIGERERE